MQGIEENRWYGLVPLIRIPRLKHPDLKRAPKPLPRVSQRADEPSRAPAQDIADGRGLRGPGVDRSVASIRGELTQKEILTASPDNMDRIELRPSNSSRRSWTQR